MAEEQKPRGERRPVPELPKEGKRQGGTRPPDIIVENRTRRGRKR